MIQDNATTLLLHHRGDVGQHVLEAAPPPPGTIVGILRIGIALPVGAVGGNELGAAGHVDVGISVTAVCSRSTVTS